MDAFTRREFKPREDVKISPSGRTPKCRHAADIVVIRDGENRDVNLESLFNDVRRVCVFISSSSLSAKGGAVVMRIHLEGAAVKDSARGKYQGSCDRVR